MNSGLLDFDDARSQLLARAAATGATERVPTLQAAGRVLAEPQVSALDVPPMDNSQMDGYAVRVSDVAAGRPLPVSQRIAAGQSPGPLAPGTVARIFTGAPIPQGADAVVMQEQVEYDAAAQTARLAATPSAGEWIRRRGEDIRAGATILPAGVRLTPQALGLIASVGVAQVRVHRRLRVGCFFTGDELAMPGEPLRPGAIYNSNRFVLTALLSELGCDVVDLGIVPDTLAATRAALRQAAADCDLIVTSGGVSVGDEDHVKPAVQAEGELQLWQIAIKPGKPLAYGRVATAHFIGLPGNPVSAFVTFLLLVRPFVLRLQGVADVDARALALRADFDWRKPDRRREFLRARMNDSGGLDLFPNQGSAVLTSTVWADGLIDNPPQRAITRGDTVRFLPFSNLLR
ncbi:MAG TPA: gephyrin-like molybdotransferase Glp [Burkholderiaceae bacterium]|nr:gephyrin-like molybdotransferase Glp [Burkholderiaceae bacterium]